MLSINLYPKPNTYILISKLKNDKIVKQYSYKDTGFLYSNKRYWPASSIKLSAAIAFGIWLKENNILIDNEIEVLYKRKKYKLKPYKLIYTMLKYSSNKNYDWAVRIPGKDFHNKIFCPTVLHRPYYFPTPFFDYSSSVYLNEKKIQTSKKQNFIYSRCKKFKNCTSLKHLQNILIKLYNGYYLNNDLITVNANLLIMSAIENITEIGFMKKIFKNKRIWRWGKSGTVKANDYVYNSILCIQDHPYCYAVSFSTRYKNKENIKHSLRKILTTLMRK